MDKVYYQYRDSLMNATKIMDDSGTELEGDSLGMGVIRKEIDLTNEEKQYLLAVERGDIPSTRQYLAMISNGANININCVDPLGRTALLIAIENENIEMIELLLAHNIEVGDALLHAINEENVEAVEFILNHEVQMKGEEVLHHSVPSSSFTPDITPIILAAHRDNYEIIKMLLDRGFRIPKPHDVRCNCKNCVTQSKEDSLRHSRSRINAYRALASPSLIALSSKDPILTSFELSWELKRLSKLENEFKLDYEKLAKKCQEFAVDLLEQTRGSKELEIILNHESSCPGDEQDIATVDNKMKLSRLKLAIKYKQKKFVAHPNCQQLLATLWYEGCPGFRRRNIVCKLLITVTIGMMFPLLCITYLIAPKSSVGLLIRKPFIKFLCHSFAYATFLLLLIMVSQRVEIPLLDNKGTSFIKETKTELRGAPATTIEWMILAYVAGYIWTEIKQLWDEGAEEYIHDMWNILDFVTNSLYIATLTLRVIAYLQVKKELEKGELEYAYLQRRDWDPYDPNLISEALFAAANIFSSLKLIYIFTVKKELEKGELEYAYLQRRDWDPYDPNLISEALFAAANIFSSLKLIYIFTVNPHLGPLQISLGRMINDLMKFAMLYLLVLFSFACGLNHLHWYYATLRSEECQIQRRSDEFVKDRYWYAKIDPCDRKYKSFANLFEIIQSLYWAIYGLVDLDHVELEEPHEFTEFVGKLMFGSYSWIAFVILLNILIAMMSNSYQNISSQADEEWKFARSKLWISYFEESGTLPAPFNIIPSPKTFYYIMKWCKDKICFCSKDRKHSRWQSIRKVVKKINEREIRYQAVMRDLIKRYVMAKQRSPQRGDGVTEDDVNELKQDISSFRYELLEILRNNGMKTPNLNAAKPSNRRLSRRKNQRRSLERLKKSFTIGNIADNMAAGGNPEQQQQDPSDMLSAFRPPPVTESCTNDIPETIIEEAESEGGARRLSNAAKKIETIADVIQSSTESNTSNMSVSDNEARKTVSFSADLQKWNHSENKLLTGSRPGNRERGVTRNQVTSDHEVNLLGDDTESAYQSNSLNSNSVANNNTNSKVKPIQGQSFEKAVGFLLESKARRKPMVVKRVKFN